MSFRKPGPLYHFIVEQKREDGWKVEKVNENGTDRGTVLVRGDQRILVSWAGQVYQR